VSIEKLRHPLIETQNRQSKYVTHDVQLGYTESGQGWLLYGMNASGKSSLMKAIGLAVLLAQIGSYVPAKQMTLRPFRRIATRILNQDNLWAGLSSFAVEMSELREILSVADHQTLVLGDELCSGTESISGTAIVAAGIQHLYKAGARFVLATHLHDLMKLSAVTSLSSLRVWHLHVEYVPASDMLIYHRSLQSGPGSTLYGLEVAKALHLPTDMIDAAFSLRRQLLGEAAAEDAKSSDWNAAVQRTSCSSCGGAVSAQLQVHHLDERHKASADKRNEDGLALNHVRNLTVLCASCHAKHHANLLYVGPVEDTSEGPRRQVLDLSRFAHQPSESAGPTVKTKFSKEQLAKIQQTVQQYPGLHARLLVFQIQHQHQIQITESQLKLLLKKGVL
jgi:DNA mismatch repair protein MutS